MTLTTEQQEEIKKDPANWVSIGGGYRVQGFIDTMMHRVPDAICLDRKNYILTQCKDKKVLHLGCRGDSPKTSGFHEDIIAVAEIVYGIDIVEMDCPNFVQMDLEKDDWVDYFKDKEIDVIVASEIIEHLNNAGMFLEKVHRFGLPVIITVPNAHCQTQYSLLRVGIEYDNASHVAKYSYHTMKNLLDRHDFEIKWFAWLNWFVPYYSKGLLFVVFPREKSE